MLIFKRKTIPLQDTDKDLFVYLYFDTNSKKKSVLVQLLEDNAISNKPWHGEVNIAEKEFELSRRSGVWRTNVSHIVIRGKEKTVDDESFLHVSFAPGGVELFIFVLIVLGIFYLISMHSIDLWLSLFVICFLTLIALLTILALNKSENALDDYIEKIRSQETTKHERAS